MRHDRKYKHIREFLINNQGIFDILLELVMFRIVRRFDQDHHKTKKKNDKINISFFFQKIETNLLP
jgi:hypothetical protein